MATNKHATIRYHALDRCFSNYGRKFFIENLIYACNEAIYEFDKSLIVLALSGGELVRAAKDMGLRTALEVFADRAYEEDGSLVDRRKEGAMVTDEGIAIKRVVRMVKEGKVTAITGKDISIKADSICVHGDGEKALAFVEKIRQAMQEEGVEICSLNQMIK